MADSDYDSKRNRRFLKKRGYNAIIKYNKKNTKDKELLKQQKFTKKEKEIYKKRMRIESFFSQLKNFATINQIYRRKPSQLKKSYLLVKKHYHHIWDYYYWHHA